MVSVVRGSEVVASPNLSLSSPLKPILSRKSKTVLGTRKRDGDSDSSESEQQRQPSKRQKTVAFDETLNTVKEIGTKSLQEVKRQVKKALDGHSKGDDGYYDELKDTFASDRRSPRVKDEAVNSQELILYILALTSHTPLLARCSGLIKQVLSCQWLTRDDVFAKAYVQFLASFVSAQGSCMSQVLGMIIAKFRETRVATKPPPGYEPVEKSVVRERLHLALRYIIKLFPSCQQIVLRELETHFPSSEESTEIHVEYVDNLLILREYTAISRDIVELITAKCCELDIEMQLDLADDNDDTAQQIMAELRAASQAKEEEDYQSDGEEAAEYFDSDDDDSDVESLLSDDPDIQDDRRHYRLVSKIQSMDAILDRLFELYSRELADPNSDAAAACFEEILADFVNIILVRYKSRHSQFIIFWAAQKSPEFSSRFIGALLDIIIGDESRPALVKQTAVSFLAGFVSRAAQVATGEVQTVVACLLNYIDYFRMKYEPNCQGPDLTRYPVFYALFQGLLYTFCFRWRDLVTEGPDEDRDDLVSYQNSDLVWLGGLERSLKASVHSKLNPLKVCAPGIVQEFAGLAHALNLIYVYPRIELNKSITMSSMTLTAYGAGTALRDTGDQRVVDERWAPLQAEFPFDPYHLPLSRRWLDKENLYLSWESIPKPGGRMVDDDSDTDDSDEDEEDLEESGPLESD